MDIAREAQMLQNVPLFSGLSAPELKLLAFTSQMMCFAPGEVLMHKGDPGDCAYVILEGEADALIVTSDGEEHVIGVRGPNMIAGEIGVLTDAPRIATVRARTPVKAMRVTRDVFLRIASSSPQRALHVMREISKLLLSAHKAADALREDLQKAKAATRTTS